MNLDIHVIAELNVAESIAGLLQIEVCNIPGSQILNSSVLTLEPYATAEPFTDVYGNPCRRMQFPDGDLKIDYKANVTIPDGRLPMLKPLEISPLELPPDTLLYLLPSRYCQSDLLVAMAEDQFGDSDIGWARVQNICDWIHQHIIYQYGTSDSGTSAYDTAAQRHGVCRDFAHLGIAFCRALGIPARYVSGYCLELDPPDFHAWFQAYLDGHWVAFDATQRQPRPALVMMAMGRDAADCAWSTFYGFGTTKSLSVQISEQANSSTSAD